MGWQYDAAGNLLNEGETTYTYDARNRLLSTTRGSATTTNTSTGDGVLVARTAGGTTTRYVQDLAAPMPQVLAATQGTATTRYVYGVERLASVSGSTRTWYSHDALGSVWQVLNDQGAAFATQQYDVLGVPTNLGMRCSPHYVIWPEKIRIVAIPRIDLDTEVQERFGDRPLDQLTTDEAGRLLSELQQRPRLAVESRR